MSNIQASDVSASVRAAFNFSVDKFPLSGPDNMPTDQYGLFRSDTGYIEGVKSISDRYVPHSTDDVCALVEAAAEAFDDEIECRTLWQKGHYVSIQPTRADRLRVYGENDNIWPRVMIRGGFDGKGFQGSVGYYRDACRNLSIPRMVEGNRISIRHTSGLRAKMDELIAAFLTLKDGFANVINMAQTMQARDVNLSEFVREVYADRVPSAAEILIADSGTKVRAVTTFEKMMETIMDRVVREREKTGRDKFEVGQPKIVSAWEAYNAVQGYVQHDAQAKTGFTSDMARIIRASADKHVLAAEKLALAA